MAVQPQAGIAPPQGDGDAAEEVSGGGGGWLKEPTLLVMAWPMYTVNLRMKLATGSIAVVTMSIHFFLCSGLL